MILKFKQQTKNFLGIIGKSSTSTKFRSIILCYHSIHDSHPFSTPPDNFREQIEYLASEFKIISLSDLYQKFQRNELKNHNYAVVTFDDGYQDNYTTAFPIIKDFDIKPTIFVTTGFINREIDITANFPDYKGMSPLTWDEIGEMVSYGIEIESHTHSHCNLAELDFNQTVDELSWSKQIIEERVGVSPIALSYPVGQLHHFRLRTISAAKKTGYQLACSTLWGPVKENDPIFALPRIRIDPWDTLDEFKSKIHGYWDYIRYVQVVKSNLHKLRN